MFKRKGPLKTKRKKNPIKFNYGKREDRAKRKKKFKDQLYPRLVEWAVDKGDHKDKSVLVGIDMSLNNPGVCVMSNKEKFIRLYFFNNRSSLELKTSSRTFSSSHPVFPGFKITCESLGDMDRSNHEDMTRFRRYQTTKAIADVIRPFAGTAEIVIEDYAPGVNPNTVKKLHEVGTCLRLRLLEDHDASCIHEVQNKTIKQTFSLDGKADKDYMFWSFSKDYLLPDLVNMVMPKKTAKDYKSIPSPMNDMVDALACACQVFIL